MAVAVPQARAFSLEDVGNSLANAGNTLVETLSNGFNGIVQSISSFGSDDEIELYAVEGADKVVDPGTTNAWETLAAKSDSTANIGRIWTDKSAFSGNYGFSGALEDTSVVKGDDSDFLVGLSAISSTSNLKTTTTTTQPLDIVMVLDRSGSMDDSFNYYSPVFDPETGYGAPGYYIVVDGDYQQIWHDQDGWCYTTGLGWWQTRHGVTYDETTFAITAHVTVVDGKLVAAWESADKTVVFENEYDFGEEPEPEKPSKPGIPQTGDFAVAAIGGTGLAAVALIATGLYLRRRNSY